ncbi:ABC transporter permease [Nonlabens sp. Asnod2-A12]|uniref:ABC transporter permease n=1 Tax=Nonlabens sp. Asnod2-A12 TaxID=3160578 RepID=UPI00386F0663
MSAIKNLFKTKNEIKLPVENEVDTKEAREQVRITYYQSGYGDSAKALGEPLTLGMALRDLYNSFEDLCRKQLNEQEILKQPHKQNQEQEKTNLRKLETALSIYDGQIKTKADDIDRHKHEIVDVKQNPDKYGIDADKRPKAQFYIGLILLLPITIYLFVFYISASYSSFFKNFEDGSLTAAIFDAEALSKALNDGLLEAVFVGTIPFVFMGLGYLVHMFQKEKGWKGALKLILLFVLTFLFDVILAYLIEKKIFDFNALPGQSFTANDALQSVNFWGIIFAGFVVYVIWGLVFDFVMKEHENVDKIKNFIRSKKEAIKNDEDKKKELIEKVDKLKHDISEIEGKIAELQSKIDGFIFPVKEYLHYHFQYMKGWYQAINSELKFPNKQLDDLRESCEVVANEHLNKLNLSEADHQNVVYT